MAWLAFGAQTRELHDGETIVGSGADADWRVATADLKPRHFVVLMHGLNLSVRPYLAESVVVVNGKQITGASKLLQDGDVIAAGSGRFIYADDAPRIEAVPPIKVAIAYLLDDTARVAHALVSRSTPIGRDASNAVVVRAPNASRFHAEVRREAGGYALHSSGATGTRMNGRALEGPCLLSDGDTFEIAGTSLRFALAAPTDYSVAAHEPVHETPAARRATVLSARAIDESAADGAAEPNRTRAVAALLVVGIIVASLLWVLLR